MSPYTHIPRLLIAGTHSGVGKTSLCAGIIAAMRRRGLVVQPFKCGPDYIDPGYHSAAADRPCRNLDTWMLAPEQVKAGFDRACAGADIAVIEGVMGLFDGSGFLDDTGSAAHVARLLDAPVVLVMDISGAARSAAAVARGFAEFEKGFKLGGVLLNFAGSAAHAQGCAEAIRHTGGPATLGWLARNPGIAIPERHLGLGTAPDNLELDKLLTELADACEASLDLGALLSLAESPARHHPALTLAAQCPGLPAKARHLSEAIGPGKVLAVPQDEAFRFHYPDNLDLLREAGIRVAHFSPVRGDSIPEAAEAVYLGGGYPELHASALAANQPFLRRLRELHAHKRPIWGECGGFMVLTEGITDLQGNHHPLARLIPGTCRMTQRLQSMGYRYATLLQDSLLGNAGTTLRAHEFHYSVWECPEAQWTHPAFRIRGSGPHAAEQLCGWAKDGLLASYLHVHLAGC